MLTAIKTYLADWPTTNTRIVISCALAIVYCGTLLVCIVAGRTIDFDVIATLGGFLLAMMGLDVVQYTQKRKTFTPDAPAPEPTAPAAVPVITLTRED